MLLINRWAKLGPTLLVFGFITACATAQRDSVNTAPVKQLVAIPELDPKAGIPLKVAVYIAPRILGRSAILDLRQSDSVTKNIIHSGATGAATITAVTQYFPAVFEEVYLVSNFPDARLLKRKLDLIVVIQDTATQRQLINSQPANEIWETQIKLGLYRPDGTKLTQYSVTASSKPRAEDKPADVDGMIRWVYRASQESIKPAMRLALHRFPKADVLNTLRNTPMQTAPVQSKMDWEKFDIPLPDMTLEQYLNRQSQLAAEHMAMANAMAQLNSKVIAQYYARNPAAFDKNMLNLGVGNKAIAQVYVQQLQTFAEGNDPNKRPLAFQFIGGLKKNTQSAKTSPSPTAITAQQNAIVAPASQNNAYPEIGKTLALLDGLKHVGKPASGGYAADGSKGNCLDELRQIKQTLLDSAKESSASIQLLRSAASGVAIYSNKFCSTPVPQSINQAQSLSETRRIALCGVQTVNCAMAKTYTGMDCQLAVNRCMQESPIPK